jgi:ABC-type glutathione transport system ATPase component
MTEKARLRNVPPDGKYPSRVPNRSFLLSSVPPQRHQPLRPVVLRVDSLQKRYGEIDAVAGVRFDVREGEVLGLLGPNGAGIPKALLLSSNDLSRVVADTVVQ